MMEAPQLAREFFDALEEAARSYYADVPDIKTEWDGLPEKDRASLILAFQRLLDRGIIVAGGG